MAQPGTQTAGFWGVCTEWSKVGAKLEARRGDRSTRNRGDGTGVRELRGTESALTLVVLRLLLVLTACALTACGEHATGPEALGTAGASFDGTAGAGSAELGLNVELGVPAGDDDLSFAPLDDGAEVRLQTFGQGGTHIVVAVRCTSCGKRMFVSAELSNLATGIVVAEPEPARPQLLYCADGEDGACELVPYLVHASGLTESDQEKDGLRALLTAKARTETGEQAESSREIVLSTADL